MKNKIGSKGLEGVANALLAAASGNTLPDQEELRGLADAVLRMREEWAVDEQRAKGAPFTKMKREVKLVRSDTGPSHNETELERDLNELLADGWEIVYSKVDMMSQPKWRVLLTRKVQG